jgi:hypothetical protein
MEPRTITKLFHTIVVLGMSMGTGGCSSADPGPADSGPGGNKDAAQPADSGAGGKDAADDAFLGWAPCH